jgi:hypothetical protein
VAPDKVAVSYTEPPIEIEVADNVVEIEGVFFFVSVKVQVTVSLGARIMVAFGETIVQELCEPVVKEQVRPVRVQPAGTDSCAEYVPG